MIQFLLQMEETLLPQLHISFVRGALFHGWIPVRTVPLVSVEDSLLVLPPLVLEGLTFQGPGLLSACA